MTRQTSSRRPPETAQEPLSRLLTVRQLAELLQVPPKTIYTWRYKGIGPPAIPIGRYLRFRAEDVAAWIHSRADVAADHHRREVGSNRPETGHRSPIRSRAIEMTVTPRSPSLCHAADTERAPTGVAKTGEAAR